MSYVGDGRQKIILKCFLEAVNDIAFNHAGADKDGRQK